MAEKGKFIQNLRGKANNVEYNARRKNEKKNKQGIREFKKKNIGSKKKNSVNQVFKNTAEGMTSEPA